MRPRKHDGKGTGDLFRARLDQIINRRHEPVRLAGEIDWNRIDGQVADCFPAGGRPASETRFMIAIVLLKQIHGLSDEGLWERWGHDPCFQHLTGETRFQHRVPHERSGPAGARHPPRDRRRRGLEGGLCHPPGPGRPDRLPATAPARLEALQPARPRGRVHRQRQGAQAP